MRLGSCWKAHPLFQGRSCKDAGRSPETEARLGRSREALQSRLVSGKESGARQASHGQRAAPAFPTRAVEAGRVPVPTLLRPLPRFPLPSSLF